MEKIKSKINYILFFLMIVTFGIFNSRKLLAPISLIVIGVTLLVSAAAFVWSLFSFFSVSSKLAKRYYLLFAAISTYMLLSGVLNYLVYERAEWRYLLLDIATMLVAVSGISCCIHGFNTERFVRRLLVFSALGGAICGIISAANANWNISLTRTDNIYALQYVMWGMLFIWPYMIFWVMLNGKKKTLTEYILCILCAVEYIVLGLLFQKRVVLFEMLGVVLVICVCNRKKIRSLLKYIISLALVSAAAVYIIVDRFGIDLVKMIENVLSRFEDADIASYDRMREFLGLFDQYNPASVIFGMGFGSVQDGPGYGNVHIGWFNFLFKGGFLLVLLNVVLLVRALRLMLASKRSFSLFVSASCVYYYYIIITLSAWFPSGQLVVVSVFQFAMLVLYEKRFAKKRFSYAAPTVKAADAHLSADGNASKDMPESLSEI